MTISAGTFGKHWLAYTIRQDEAGWRLKCSLLAKEIASGVELTEAVVVWPEPGLWLPRRMGF